MLAYMSAAGTRSKNRCDRPIVGMADRKNRQCSVEIRMILKANFLLRSMESVDQVSVGNAEEEEQYSTQIPRPITFCLCFLL